MDPPSREETFRELGFRTSRLVQWHFIQRGVPREEVEDLAQDTFLAAVRGFADFRGDTGGEHWLLTIAENRWRNVVERLPTQMRNCATLRLFQGLSYKEVATTLRISVDAVKVQVFRAKKRIRSKLRECFDEPVRESG